MSTYKIMFSSFTYGTCTRQPYLFRSETISNTWIKARLSHWDHYLGDLVICPRVPIACLKTN